MQQPLVSVVILSYKSADYIGPCLRSIATTVYPNLEVVVADNASADGSVEAARAAAQELGMEINLLALTDNRGCAGGNNAGWRASRGEIIVFLNPDTTVTPSFVREVTAPLIADPSIAITGAKIYWPDTRRLQHAGGILYPNAMSDHHGAGQEDTGQFDVQREVDYVTGAGFAIRRNLLERLGGFDEDYFPAYFEETDLCLRVRRAGYRVVYVPTAVFYHHESVTLVANSRSFRTLYQRMRIRFCIKNYSLRQWLTEFIPFEVNWLLHEPTARGNRLEQFRAYAEGIWWWVGKKFTRK